MYIFQLAIKRVFSHPANSLISIVLFALGCAVIFLLILAGQQTRQQVERNLGGIDLVVGAKGSPLQLILSSVLHADYPTGNISLAETNRIRSHPLVKKTIPIALGDNHLGYRIVGTPVQYAEVYDMHLQKGEWYENPMEAVIGYDVSRETGLNIGDQFTGVHGFHQQGHAHPNHIYTVTGIMEGSGKVPDRLILTPVETVWKVHENPHQHEKNHRHSDSSAHDCDHEHDHDHEPHKQHQSNRNLLPESILGDADLERFLLIQKKVEDEEDLSKDDMEFFVEVQFMLESRDTEHREITALLVFYRSAAGNIQLPAFVNDNTQMQAASPVLEFYRLWSLLDDGFRLIRGLAIIIIAISVMLIWMQLYQSLKRSKPELALIRVLGGSKADVFLLLLWQGLILAFLGILMGWIGSRILWLVLPSFYIFTEKQIIGIQPQDGYLVFLALMGGFLVSLIPAIQAYRSDIHYSLTHNEDN